MAMPLASLDHGIFNLHLGIDEKIFRSLLVFIFLAVALRLGGKREMGQLNVLDLAVLLLASNALQNALIGDDNSVTGGVIGATTLFVRLTFSNSRARRILEGTPRVLLRNGEADAEALRKEAITDTELVDIVLQHGFSDLHDVGLVMIETNGQFVCLNRDQAKKLRPQMLEQPG
jgi:uncharacterized membrane protein YcaP (DUF421 family)